MLKKILKCEDVISVQFVKSLLVKADTAYKCLNSVLCCKVVVGSIVIVVLGLLHRGLKCC